MLETMQFPNYLQKSSASYGFLRFSLKDQLNMKTFLEANHEVISSVQVNKN